MALVQVYQCDHCKKHINDPAKGLIIKGFIWQADPSIVDLIETGGGSPLIEAQKEETVFCLTCFENRVRNIGGNSCVRSMEEKNKFPRLVN